MPREKESYRENLAMLMESFQDKKLLTAMDVSRWSGVDYRTIRKHYFKGGKKYIALPELASKIS
jgi:hypothetical protein